MAWPPGVQDFKDQFFREFIYGTGLDTVTDKDILRAIREALANFNQALYSGNNELQLGTLYLAAHRLWVNINNGGGLSATPRGRGLRSQPEYAISSKAVAQVNVTYKEPPERIASSPALSALWASPFGYSWCEMFSNRLIGNVAVVGGPDQVTMIPDPVLDQQ